MSQNRTIQKVLKEIEQAETLLSQSASIYYRAKQRLLNITAAPEKGKVLSDEQVARLISKRLKTAIKK